MMKKWLTIIGAILILLVCLFFTQKKQLLEIGTSHGTSKSPLKR
ncbi:MAG: hypothetical protein EOO95_05780 [Pedobacter sp.]|nr:MAG: hypothetical protein EOO95_05780 [Pedobacter sp.]